MALFLQNYERSKVLNYFCSTLMKKVLHPVRDILGLGWNGTLLDIGCGDGSLTGIAHNAKETYILEQSVLARMRNIQNLCTVQCSFPDDSLPVRCDVVLLSPCYTFSLIGVLRCSIKESHRRALVCGGSMVFAFFVDASTYGKVCSYFF